MDKLMDAVETEKAQRQHDKEIALHDAESLELVDELVRRGVPFSTVWGRYYEHEEAGTSKEALTVGDALDTVTGNYEQLRLF